MEKKILLVMLLYMTLCFFGCENRPTTVRKKDVHPEPDPIVQIPLEKKSGFASSLSKVLEDFIEMNKKRNLNTTPYPVLALIFEQKKEECFMIVTTTHFYDSERMIGYDFFDKYLIYLHNNSPECFSLLIDTSELQNGIIPDSYINENSENFSDTYFEPYQRKYKLHGNDSLELIYEGFW